MGIQPKFADDDAGELSDSSFRRKSRSSDAIYENLGNSSRKIRLKVVPVNRSSDEDLDV